jgi:hypothetical protein
MPRRNVYVRENRVAKGRRRRERERRNNHPSQRANADQERGKMVKAKEASETGG